MAYADREFDIKLDSGNIVKVEMSVYAWLDVENENVWHIEDYSYIIMSNGELSSDEERELEEKLDSIYEEFDWHFDEG